MVGWNVAVTQLVAGQDSDKDKYFLCVISTTVFCLMNCDEHVECFDECICFHYILHVLTSVYVFKFNVFYIMLWGLNCRFGEGLNEQIFPRLLLIG